MVFFRIPIRPRYPTKWRDHYVDPKDEKTEWFNPWRYKIGKWEYGTENDMWTRHPTFDDRGYYTTQKGQGFRHPRYNPLPTIYGRPRYRRYSSLPRNNRLVCYFCGRTGHIMKYCWRAKQAGQA